MVWTTLLQRSDLLKENPLGLWGASCSLVVWMERNKRVFESYGREKIDLWETVWASTSKNFKDYTLFPIVLNWQADVV